jgi:hypothetical protein
MLTPIQIALLADLHASFVAHPPLSEKARSYDDSVAVWGSWQRAAMGLLQQGLVHSLGTATGTRDLEWRTLRGRHRRGATGRRVHLYRLARSAAPLAARCAAAVRDLPAGRQHATWKDVPAVVRAGDRCHGCGCTPGRPCVTALPGGCGEGGCVAAGVFGFERCSACLFERLAAA